MASGPGNGLAPVGLLRQTQVSSDRHLTKRNVCKYITTAIDYPNAPPHIGNALEKVAADVAARYQRLRGYDTDFSGGLDENSQHVVKAASAHATDLASWTKRMNAAFRLAWSKLDVSYDRWLRTTEAGHFLSAYLPSVLQELAPVEVDAGWYFPSIGEYASLLEKNGLLVCSAWLFDRPTKLEEGEKGLRNWIEMFGGSMLQHVPRDAKQQAIERTETKLRDQLFKGGHWFADYKRLRIIAYRE